MGRLLGGMFAALIAVTGCSVEVIDGTALDDSSEAAGGDAGGLVADGGAGGQGGDDAGRGGAGQGGDEPMGCVPGDVCREAAGWCDAPEVWTDACECPDDLLMPQGSIPAAPSYDHIVEVCAGAACDGTHVDCPSTCPDGDDGSCIPGWFCVDWGYCVEG